MSIWEWSGRTDGRTHDLSAGQLLDIKMTIKGPSSLSYALTRSLARVRKILI